MTSLKDISRRLSACGCLVDILADYKDDGHEIKRVIFDSRKATKGDLFCCVPGVHSNGYDFAGAAVDSGASALMCADSPNENWGVPVLVVKDVRRAMGRASSLVNGDPSSKMTMVAVTGTNGKSTTSYMIRSIMETKGRTGLLGTIQYHNGVKALRADRTTPEGPDIQDILAEMVSCGCHGCVMEASSHGISQGRLESIEFDAAVFTNLTPEHLDYHGDMDSYFKVKSLLFKKYMKADGKKIFNLDDPYGRILAGEYGSEAVSFGIASSDAVVSAKNLQLYTDGVVFDLSIDGKTSQVQLPFLGKYNVSNALAASATAFALGFSSADILEGLSRVPTVPGRMERYSLDNGVCAVVDYAHTPDALKNLLKACREVCSGRLISVFGLGGERFKGNRWMMGEIAAEMADHVVLTMDNPRGEAPEAIVEDILIGVNKVPGASHETVIDRGRAVETALDQASSGDMVVISGKGPEDYILMKGEKFPYSDADAIRRWAKNKGVSWV